MTSKQAPAKLRFAAIAVDIVVFGIRDGKLSVLLGRVNRPPYYVDSEAFIGGIMTVNETAEDAVARHLQEKTNVRSVYTEQLYTFSDIERDPRNRVVSVAYLGLASPAQVAAEQMEGTRWCALSDLPKLAYDHNAMAKVALKRLREKCLHTTAVRYILPKVFTISELQDVYELIFDTTFDKRNFRRKIRALDILEDTGEVQTGVRNRPAALYTFKSNKTQELSPIM